MLPACGGRGWVRAGRTSHGQPHCYREVAPQLDLQLDSQAVWINTAATAWLVLTQSLLSFWFFHPGCAGFLVGFVFCFFFN